MIAFFREFFLP